MSDEQKAIPESISYGTHTLPREFWTSGKPGLLNDASFRRRRAEKNARHIQNGIDRSERQRSKK